MKNASLYTRNNNVYVLHKSNVGKNSFDIRELQLDKEVLSDPILNIKSHYSGRHKIDAFCTTNSDKNPAIFLSYSFGSPSTRGIASPIYEFTTDVFVLSNSMDEVIGNFQLKEPTYEENKNDKIIELGCILISDSSLVYQYKVDNSKWNNSQWDDDYEGFTLITELYHYNDLLWKDTMNYVKDYIMSALKHPYINDQGQVEYIGDIDLINSVENCKVYNSDGIRIKEIIFDSDTDLTFAGLNYFKPNYEEVGIISYSSSPFGIPVGNYFVVPSRMEYVENGLIHEVDSDREHNGIYHTLIDGEVYTVRTTYTMGNMTTQIIRWVFDE